MKAKFFTIAVATVLSTPFAQAEQTRFLVSDQDAIQARVDIIQQAEKEILAEYFSVWNDDQSVGGMALLIDAARRGRKVKIIMDSMSSKVPTELFAALKRKGVGADGVANLEVKVYNPGSLNLAKITHRDHAKMLIADGDVLITGGRNVGDKYFGINTKRNFSDLDLLVKGNTAAVARANFLEVWNSKLAKAPQLITHSEDKLDPAICSYADNYYNCRTLLDVALKEVQTQEARLETHLQEILSDNNPRVRTNTNKNWFAESKEIEKIQFMSQKPDELVSGKTAFLTDDLIGYLKSAKTDVNIVSPYLIPPEPAIIAMAQLIARGVRVRVITNSMKSTDNLFAQAGYRYRRAALVKMGVEIYEYMGPNTIHAKTALIDNQRILIGTYNMDPRSSFINREVGLAILDDQNTGLASELEGIIEHFRSQSMLVAKDGVEQNLEWQNEGISPTKKRLMNALMLTMPVLINQL